MSKPITHYQRRSLYIPMSDGIRLAADIFFPDCDSGTPRSVVFCLTPYRRAYIPNEVEKRTRDGVERLIPRPESESNLVTLLDHMADGPVYQTLLLDDFVVAAIDIRGTGASEGTWPGAPAGKREVLDTHECVDWIAQQSWCDGSIGMYGSSYMGQTQFCAAISGHPALKAIMPVVAPFNDTFDSYFPGGLGLIGFLKDWFSGREDRDLGGSIAPVDEDPDGIHLSKILQKRRISNTYMDVDAQYEMMRHITRDTVQLDNRQLIEYFTFDDGSEAEPMLGFCAPLKDRDFPVYSIVGATDIYSLAGVLWQQNLGPNSRMLFVQADHKSTSRRCMVDDEALNWFRWKLRKEKTPLKTQPRIKVERLSTNGELEYVHMNEWPDSRYRVRFYCNNSWKNKEIKNPCDKTQASICSEQENYQLTLFPPKITSDTSRTVDESAGLGSSSRWLASGLTVQQAAYTDLAQNDSKGIVYESAQLDMNIDLIGTPTVSLCVSSSADVVAWIVYLTEVQPNEESNYLTEGCLRSDLRRTSAAPFESDDLPYHPSLMGEQLGSSPESFYTVRIAMQPLARRVLTGSRIRLVVINADSENYLTPQLPENTQVAIRSGQAINSFIELPVYKGELS